MGKTDAATAEGPVDVDRVVSTKLAEREKHQLSQCTDATINIAAFINAVLSVGIYSNAFDAGAYLLFFGAPQFRGYVSAISSPGLNALLNTREGRDAIRSLVQGGSHEASEYTAVNFLEHPVTRLLIAMLSALPFALFIRLAPISPALKIAGGVFAFFAYTLLHYPATRLRDHTGFWAGRVHEAAGKVECASAHSDSTTPLMGGDKYPAQVQALKDGAKMVSYIPGAADAIDTATVEQMNAALKGERYQYHQHRQALAIIQLVLAAVLILTSYWATFGYATNLYTSGLHTMSELLPLTILGGVADLTGYLVFCAFVAFGCARIAGDLTFGTYATLRSGDVRAMLPVTLRPQIEGATVATGARDASLLLAMLLLCVMAWCSSGPALSALEKVVSLPGGSPGTLLSVLVHFPTMVFSANAGIRLLADVVGLNASEATRAELRAVGNIQERVSIVTNPMVVSKDDFLGADVGSKSQFV